ncbi:molybdopterin-binding oxidoreductase [Haloferax sp. Atlit-6N]|uniref:Molybdopterin-binding domain protein n=1 Tax=Haloferax gibbonsii TaxID=35746 RepID=A0A871BKC9_HALGI|nr:MULTISPECIES: molybdopterin-dependent oxidoreductase [Haloferax]QOS13462.1 molybdopterin-binding domain protein [Haloferax gibbonsii]REA00556.1 molybdopterin-binding oxidoreductase [Haloferax sp. Atlit-6N]
MTDLRRHRIPDNVETSGWTLAVTGTVDTPLELSQRDFGSFPTETFEGDLVCDEGWVAEGLTWRGVRVERLFDHAGLPETSQYGLVRSMDGDYACSFPLNRLAESVLAFELGGEPLDTEHGGPARLVPTADDRDCWESVKWVSEIEVLEHVPTEADTAKEIALSRIG